jgi:ankyrin repeat protein
VENMGGDPSYYKSLPLRWAAAAGNVDMIKYLIEHGANPDDSDSGNALTVATSYDKKEAIDYLTKLKNKY